MADKRKASSSSSSSSNSYSQTATKYQNKIDEYETAKYNYQKVWKEEKTNDIEKINEQIKKLRSKYSQVSRIDSLRTSSNNINNRIKQLEKNKLKIREIIKTIPTKIQELDDCISYYTNKLNNKKDQSVHCVYSKKSNKKVLKK